MRIQQEEAIRPELMRLSQAIASVHSTMFARQASLRNALADLCELPVADRLVNQQEFMRSSAIEEQYMDRLREELKGLQDVLPYFQSNTGATLLIAGEGDFEPVLRKYAGDSENIHFLGQKTSSQLRELYKHAIATIIPSLTYEVSPLVIFESWSEGTPVIVREIGGLGEIVGESGGGVGFSSGEDLAEQLDLLQRDKQLRHQLGDAGHHSYRQNWSAGVHIKRYLDIITRIKQAKHDG